MQGAARYNLITAPPNAAFVLLSEHILQEGLSRAEK